MSEDANSPESIPTASWVGSSADDGDGDGEEEGEGEGVSGDVAVDEDIERDNSKRLASGEDLILGSELTRWEGWLRYDWRVSNHRGVYIASRRKAKFGC